MQSSTSPKVSLKLLIDKKTNKVVYGEASKDFIDFLFTILTLPLGTATKLLSKENMVGTLGNLYRSIEDLGYTYIQPQQRKDRVLNPALLHFPSRVAPLFPNEGSPATMEFYMCASCITFTAYYSANCPGCNRQMCLQTKIVDPANWYGGADHEDGGFVKSAVPYMVMDNLEFKPLSSMSIMALFKKLNIKDLGSIEEKVIPLGATEGLSLLKASLQTESVLTTVFLGDH